jgi:hypothetical protein
LHFGGDFDWGLFRLLPIMDVPENVTGAAVGMWLAYHERRPAMVKGNFESNKNRTSTAKAAGAWRFYGTAEAVPFCLSVASENQGHS